MQVVQECVCLQNRYVTRRFASVVLLCDTMYGPSVFPWQPKGIWLSPWNGAEWEQSKGKNNTAGHYILIGNALHLILP